ncbi:phosphatase PAP2 family protein [Cellulomonas sp. JZ18]|uniref:phosphatase PAP2 family protein n=1 Tax=Cellulomonas sp. JZ18 TaxID=2654191 RepID=UPI0012D37941|nr:phosphatase PAP2 family protein [Cellulomonas sp. JZ18]QGQ20416.1 phosphatase PAP2 family protein [Cellulomonas sp. JZ18]
MHERPSVPPVRAAAPAAGPAPSGRRRARAVVVAWAVAVALVSALAVGGLWRLFVATWAGQRVEDAALDGARFGQGRLWTVAEPVLDVVSVGFVAGVLLAAVLIAVVRRRWSLAVQVAVLVGGANLTTQAVKRLLDRPDLGVGADYGNTLPSGHTTVAASVSAALLLVVPPRARPAAAVVGAGYTAATGVSTLVGQWHRPSDVVAAAFVVLAWVAVVCGAMALTPAPSTTTAALARVAGGDRWWRRTRATIVALLVAGVGTGAFAAMLLARTWAVRGDVPTGRGELAAYAGGVSAVVAASCLAFAAMLVLRHAAGSRDETAAARA